MFRSTACAAFLLASTAGTAETADLAAAFGAREGIRSASLSSDGSKIALVVPGPGTIDYLYIVDTKTGGAPAKIMTATGKPERLRSCQWVGPARLACSVYSVQLYAGDFFGSKTVIATDADGQNKRILSKREGENATSFDFRGGGIIDQLPGEDGKVLMMRAYVPEEKIGSNITKTAQGMGVDWIDTRTGQIRRVEPARREAVEYITDGTGNVRIMGNYERDGSGYGKGTTKYLYRPPGGGSWLTLSTRDSIQHTGFDPYFVDPKSNLAYGLEMINGRQALVSVELAGALNRTVLVTDPKVDVDTIMTIGRNRRVVGASYEGDQRRFVYFDPSIKSMSSALSKALGGKPANIIDASEDETKLLLWAGNDVDPGQVYLFDKTAKRLIPVVPQRPQLAGMTLATVKPVSYPATDGTMIPAYLTLPAGSNGKGLPAIVMPHGGPESRDYYGFDWMAQYFAARGFAVIQPNFRGSAGYGADWLMKNGFKSWRTSVGDVVDAGKWLTAQGIADPAKLTIFGWSYGGYAALQSNVLAPGLFKAVVAVAPVTDLQGLIASTSKWNASYYVNKDYIGSGPHLREGSPAQNVSSFKAPVLMFTGTLDANVPASQSKQMDDRLKEAGKRSELVVFEGLDHQLDDADARKTLLQRSADFLTAAGK